MFDTIRFPLWSLLCISTTIMVFSLSLVPSDSISSIDLGWDKLDHAVAIAVTTFCAFRMFKSHRWAAPAAFSYGLLLGALIEVCQAVFTTTRSAEWGDLLADLIGAGLAWCWIYIIQRKRELL